MFPDEPTAPAQITSGQPAAVVPATAEQPDKVYKHDAHGRFVAGTSPGPGRPSEMAYRRAVREAITPDEARRLIRSLYKRGMKGDVPAARVCLEWLAAKPAPEATPKDGNGETRRISFVLNIGGADQKLKDAIPVANLQTPEKSG